jgi:hypothetical protein
VEEEIKKKEDGERNRRGVKYGGSLQCNKTLIFLEL